MTQESYQIEVLLNDILLFTGVYKRSVRNAPKEIHLKEIRGGNMPSPDIEKIEDAIEEGKTEVNIQNRIYKIRYK